MKKISHIVGGILLGVFSILFCLSTATFARQMPYRNRPSVVIDLTAANDTGWKPNRIVVKQGERVMLRVTSLDSHHLLLIPGLGVRSADIPRAETRGVTFIAPSQGSY